LALFPALPLLLLPCASARRAFVWWASLWKVAILHLMSVVVHVGLGVRVLPTHAEGLGSLRELVSAGPEVLIVSNHRSPMDWAWFFSWATLVGVARSLRVTLMYELKYLPGPGWAMQCFGFAFIPRSGSGGLDTLQRTAAASEDGGSMAMLFFPEGKDFNARSKAASDAFALRQTPPLPCYEQVLHPKTAGLGVLWASMDSTKPGRGDRQPVLLDTTLGIEPFAPGERVSEVSVLFLGRCPPTVHIATQALAWPQDRASAEATCCRLFSEKDGLLRTFYARSPTQALQPDLAKASGKVPSVCAGLTAVLALEVVAVLLRCALGAGRFWQILGAECLVFCVLSALGGVDRWLLLHARCWPSSDVCTAGSGKTALLG